MVYLNVIEELHRGGLGPLGLSSLEKKNIYFSVTEIYHRLQTVCVCVDSMYCDIISLNTDINSKLRQFVRRRKHIPRILSSG